MTKLRLELFVNGNSARSHEAATNLRRILAALAPSDFHLEIIDVREHPQAAEDSNIMVTPTLIKRAPAPVQRLLGDLSARNAVLQALGLAA